MKDERDERRARPVGGEGRSRMDAPGDPEAGIVDPTSDDPAAGLDARAFARADERDDDAPARDDEG